MWSLVLAASNFGSYRPQIYRHHQNHGPPCQSCFGHTHRIGKDLIAVKSAWTVDDESDTR